MNRIVTYTVTSPVTCDGTNCCSSNKSLMQEGLEKLLVQLVVHQWTERLHSQTVTCGGRTYRITGPVNKKIM